MKGAILTFSMIAAYAVLLIITAAFLTAPALPSDDVVIIDHNGTGDGDGGDVVECTPETCDSFGYECGNWSDGCDGTVKCGSCYGGKKCTQGACVNPGTDCTPLTCELMGHSCGTWWDGCGNLEKCGNCTGSDICINGQCAAACYPKQCGAVGYRCGNYSDGCAGQIACGRCDTGLQCVGGECIAENCTPSCACAATTCAGGSCPDGCGGTCAGTVQADCGGSVCGMSPNGCGGCGNCTAPYTCSQGACQGGTCTPSCAGKECGGNGCDGLCGRCIEGQDAHGSNPCTGGLCNPYCNQNWGNCDANRTNGCETNLLDTELHCGSCTNWCGSGEVCLGGVCTPGCSPKACGTDYQCGNWSNGCTAGTSLYCGDCTAGNHCNTTGRCEPDCAPDCSCASQYCTINACPNGCGGTCAGNLTVIADCGSRVCGTSPHSCGSCGTCQNAHGSTTCLQAGICSPVCAAGWGNCNGNNNDGCEANTTAAANCGSCGNVCTNPHGATACSGSGTCAPTCSAGWGSCDLNATNGCETVLGTNLNCAACGNVCGAGYSCQGGSCQVDNCPAGTANCTNAPGCETNILTNITNCGGCGIACTNAHGTTACSAGACAPSCSAGWTDCDGNPVNGCETQCASGVCSGGTCMTADLMMHYTFESISGGVVQDQSTFNNDGTVHDNPQLQTGIFGSGLHFDGTGDYVDAGTFTPTGQGLTISAWFKIDAIPSGKDPRILSKAQSLNLQDWELLVYRGGIPEFRVRLPGETDMSSARVYNSSRTVEAGKWYFVAGVFDGTTGKLYLNCDQIASSARSGSLIATSSSVWIGDAPPASGNRPFTGTIDDVRVYLKALTPQEIGVLYSQCTTCPPCTDPSMLLPPPPLG
jgi:hypothetical protein